MVAYTVQLSAELLESGLSAHRTKLVVAEVCLSDVLRYYRAIRFAQLTVRGRSSTSVQSLYEACLEVECRQLMLGSSC